MAMCERAIRWESLAEVDFPCPDLEFQFNARDELRVVMRFSLLNTGAEQRKLDLELRFSGVIGLKWIEECHGSVIQSSVPSRPRCQEIAWSQWVLPAAIIENSAWLSRYMNLPGTENRQHFSLVCMNDLLDVLALPDVRVRWIEAE
ncbi:hypothetical protein A9762_20630 [Pandoraea sp. ISTKB]|nr:hypothetical protein A9762_20630 [Pandoraea sp. ISTKB]